ncbi:MAG TPA: hypothetical protein VFA09_07150 [Ktedonobacteraceae bacterium]|nr:hypothetical protein [Ktedonobacteraceae bacterium]
MNSSMISKIAKAKRYAEEPERIQFTRFEAEFRGENDVHTTTYDNGEWHCTCRFFQDWGDCSHTMAMQRVLGVTIPAAHRHGIPTGIGTGALMH